jgi:hypothetical protein
MTAPPIGALEIPRHEIVSYLEKIVTSRAVKLDVQSQKENFRKLLL